MGKTIKSIGATSVNVLRLTFTDDTMLDLWAEQAVHTIGGDIPGIFVDGEDSTVEIEHNHFGEIFVPERCPGCAALQNNKD